MTRTVKPMMGTGKDRHECSHCGLSYSDWSTALLCEGNHQQQLAEASKIHNEAQAYLLGYNLTPSEELAVEDIVNHPSHYTAGGIETIDFIKAKLTPEEYRGYLRGNSMKYQSRIGLKGDALENARKGQWYQNALVEFLSE